MRRLAERVYFAASLALGRILRAGRYSTVRGAEQVGQREVRKHRRFYAPALVSIGRPLVRILNTGVRVLPQREWEERERLVYQSLYESTTRVEADGTLILPRLAGETLAALLDNGRLEPAQRATAIELATVALAALHRRGFTHGDAMAENVMVDVSGGVARWFDFETLHDPARPIQWRRADDVRALLATTLLRTPRAEVAATLDAMLDRYGDEEVTRLVAGEFASVWRRRLAFHLGQAALPHMTFRTIAALLEQRVR